MWGEEPWNLEQSKTSTSSTQLPTDCQQNNSSRLPTLLLDISRPYMCIDSWDVLWNMWAGGHFKLQCAAADKYSCWASTTSNAFNCYYPIWLDVPTLVHDFDFFPSLDLFSIIKELKSRHHSFTFYSLESVNNLFSVLIACFTVVGLSFFKQLIFRGAVQSGSSSSLKEIKLRAEIRVCSC